MDKISANLNCSLMLEIILIRGLSESRFISLHSIYVEKILVIFKEFFFDLDFLTATFRFIFGNGSSYFTRFW